MSKKPSLITDVGEALQMATDIDGQWYGYTVTDEGILAQEYDLEGNVVATYLLEVTARSTKENNA